MRALLGDEREGSPWVFFALVALLCLFVALVLALWISARHHREDCRARRIYDASSQHTREVFRQDYLDEIDEARLDTSLSPELRARKVARARRDIAALDETLGRGVHTTCGGIL